MKIHALLVLLGPFLFLAGAFNYCKIRTCAPRTHTMCIYKSSRPTFACGTVVRSYLMPSEKLSILELHNDFRRQVYTGQEKRGIAGPQPAAAKVVLLKWDDELELMAQRWSEQCKNEIDQCRNVGRFSVNQNVGEEETLGIMEELTNEEIIHKWYDEVNQMDNKDVYKFRELRAYTVGTHHYTQMVWGNTTRIGCASMRRFDGRYNRLNLVCNYGPRGNNEGEQVYATVEAKKSVKSFLNFCI